MGLGEIVDMNVITDAGAVGRGIVFAKKLEWAAFSGDGFQSGGNEMSFRIVQFADRATLVGAGGIEIAQADRAQAVSASVRFKRVFEKQFRHSVRINGLAGSVFSDGNPGGNAVDGASGRKYESFHAGIERGVEKSESSFYIVVKIFARILHALADLGIGSEVHDASDAIERARELGSVGDGGFDKFKTFCEKTMATGEIVVNEYVVTVTAQSMRGVRADIAGSADYQD